MLRYRPSRAAAEVKNRRSRRKAFDEAVVPGLVVPRSVLAVAIPAGGVALVMVYDAIR
jgi:hypothetical protein